VEKSLKGTNSIAGGNAPGKTSLRYDPVRVVLSTEPLRRRKIEPDRCDPFGVVSHLVLSGGVAPGY
jgi:hypothetical protein